MIVIYRVNISMTIGFFLAIPLKTEKEICKIVANKNGWLRSNSYSLS